MILNVLPNEDAAKIERYLAVKWDLGLGVLRGGDVDAPSDTRPCTLAEIQEIASKNTFSWQTDDRDPKEGFGRFGTTLYIIASMMNHASNAERSSDRVFCGPFMFVYANKDLPAGAELTTAYFDDRHAGPARYWGFDA